MNRLIELANDWRAIALLVTVGALVVVAGLIVPGCVYPLP